MLCGGLWCVRLTTLPPQPTAPLPLLLPTLPTNEDIWVEEEVTIWDIDDGDPLLLLAIPDKPEVLTELAAVEIAAIDIEENEVADGEGNQKSEQSGVLSV